MEVLNALIAVQTIVQTHSSTIAVFATALFLLFAIVFFWKMLFLLCKVSGILVFGFILFQGARSGIALVEQEIPSLKSNAAIGALTHRLSNKLKQFEIHFEIRRKGENQES